MSAIDDAHGPPARITGAQARSHVKRGGRRLYDRKSQVGKLDKALDEATARGWTVVDMKKEWKTVFGFE